MRRAAKSFDSRPARQRGITIIEIMVTLAIAAVLIGLARAGVQRVRRAANADGAGERFPGRECNMRAAKPVDAALRIGAGARRSQRGQRVGSGLVRRGRQSPGAAPTTAQVAHVHRARRTTRSMATGALDGVDDVERSIRAVCCCRRPRRHCQSVQPERTRWSRDRDQRDRPRFVPVNLTVATLDCNP